MPMHLVTTPSFSYVLCPQRKAKKSPAAQQFIATVILYRDDSSSSGNCLLKPIKKSERQLSSSYKTTQDTLSQSFYGHWLKSPSNIHELKSNKNYYQEKLGSCSCF